MAQAQAKRRRQVDISILDRITEGFMLFLDALTQPVENSDDAGACEIILKCYSDAKGRPCIDIIDDGLGMDEARRAAYLTLGGSTSREDKDAKGRNGTGRLGARHHCAFTRCVTKTADGKSFETILDDESMIEAWFGDNTTPLTWKPVSLGFGHVLKTSGTVVTWCDMTQGNAHTKKQHEPEYIIEHLAQKLSPHLAPKIKVQVLNERGVVVSEQPLKPRLTHGEPIKMEISGSQVGDIAVELYVVAKADRSTDFVMVGSKGPVCTWPQFSRMFRDDSRYSLLVRQLDIVLGHPQVVGYIEIPKLNKKYATNDRKSFNTRLLDDEALCHEMLELLRLKVMPRVEKELGMRADQITTTSESELVRQIVSSIHTATGERPPAQKVALLELNHHRIDIRRGDTFVFRVQNPRQGARYVWDKTNCGGDLDRVNGTEVTYTAKKIGIHKLIVQIMGEASTENMRTVTINVMDKVPMRFMKPTVPMSLNDSRTLRLENVPEDANLQWNHQDWGGNIVLSADKTEATVTSAREEGDFDVRVKNLKDEDDFAVCTLRIASKHEEDEREPKRVNRADDEFVIDGQVFQLHITKMAGSAEGNATISWLQEGAGAPHGIWLNFGHQMFATITSDSARRIIALRVICERVSQVLVPMDSSRKSLNEKIDELMNRLLK